MTEVASNHIPVANLPQWPRVGIIEKTIGGSGGGISSKPKQEHLFVPQMMDTSCHNCGSVVATPRQDGGGIDVSELSKHMEKSIQFLKAQQQELLHGLQEEIEQLRMENRNLQHQVMNQSLFQPATEHASQIHKKEVSTQPDPLKDALISKLNMEVSELKSELQEAKEKNGLLEKILDQNSSSQGASLDDIGEGEDSQQVKRLSMHTRALDHCDRIIKHLQVVNEQQAVEVIRLKAELKEILGTYKAAPDIGLLSQRNKQLADPVRLPKIADQFSHRIESPDGVHGLSSPHSASSSSKVALTHILVPHPPSTPPPHASTEVAASNEYTRRKGKIHLPPLKQTNPTRVAERKKQIDVLHKARLQQVSNNGGTVNPGNNTGNTSKP